MRVDSLGPKTWLLGGVAAWALVMWLLALAGMGGRIGDTESDGQTQRLPGAVPVAKERLGPLGQYIEIGQRPLFAEKRQPEPFTISGTGEAPEVNTFDFVLTSVLITPQARVAILRPPGDTAQPVRVKVGESVQGAQQWSLATLHPRSAVFNGPEGEKTLELRVFDGIGGAAPTPVTYVPPPPSPQPGAEGVPGPDGAPPGVQTVLAPGQIPPQGPGQGTDVSQSGVQAPPGPQPSTAEATASSAQQADLSSQQQLEAIRRRIEARRAQLRREQQLNQNAPSR